jgi:hypothetical protein
VIKEKKSLKDIQTRFRLKRRMTFLQEVEDYFLMILIDALAVRIASGFVRHIVFE